MPLEIDWPSRSQAALALTRQFRVSLSAHKKTRPDDPSEFIGIAKLKGAPAASEDSRRRYNSIRNSSAPKRAKARSASGVRRRRLRRMSVSVVSRPENRARKNPGGVGLSGVTEQRDQPASRFRRSAL